MLSLAIILERAGLLYQISPTLLDQTVLSIEEIKASNDDNQITIEVEGSHNILRLLILNEEKKGIESSCYIISSLRKDEILKKLQKAYAEMLRLSQKLLLFIEKNEHINDLLNLLSTVIPNPIVIFDPSYKLLGYSRNFQVENDPDWSVNISLGYISHTDERMKQLNNVVNQTESSARSQIYDFSLFDNRFYYAEIFFNSNHIASLSVVEQISQLDNFTLLLLKKINSILGMIINRSQVRRLTSKKAYEFLLNDILLHPNITNEEIKSRLFFEEYQVSGELAVLCIPINNMGKYHAPISSYLNELINFIHKNYHVFILENYNKATIKDIEKDLTNFLTLTKTIGIVSSSFYVIHDFYEKFQETIRTYRLVDKTAKTLVYHYDDFKINDFFYHAAQLTDIHHYYFEPVAELKKTNQELYFTLKAYIKNLKNQKGTAYDLNIHRSTLIYRLKKLSDVYGIDIDQSDVFFQAFYTIELLEVNNFIR